MEYKRDGLIVWYGGDDTPAPKGEVPADSPVSVTIGVRPAGLNNAVDVRYRINGGAERILPSTLAKGGTTGTQLFKAIFPYLPPGSTVEYVPILRSLGRRVGPPLGKDSPLSFSVARALHSPEAVQQGEPSRATAPPSKTAQPKPRAPFPYTLDQLAQVQAYLAPPQVIGSTPDGLRVNFEIIGGRIVGKRFNATVEKGGADCLRIREDGTGIVAVRTTLRTNDGAIVYTEYSGVLDLGEDGYRNALGGRFPARPRVHLAPRFLSGSPAYAWLNRLQCVGIGYVTMANLEVNYDLYAMHLADAGPETISLT